MRIIRIFTYIYLRRGFVTKKVKRLLTVALATLMLMGTVVPMVGATALWPVSTAGGASAGRRAGPNGTRGTWGQFLSDYMTASVYAELANGTSRQSINRGWTTVGRTVITGDISPANTVLGRHHARRG